MAQMLRKKNENCTVLEFDRTVKILTSFSSVDLITGAFILILLYQFKQWDEIIWQQSISGDVVRKVNKVKLHINILENWKSKWIWNRRWHTEGNGNEKLYQNTSKLDRFFPNFKNGSYHSFNNSNFSKRPYFPFSLLLFNL